MERRAGGVAETQQYAHWDTDPFEGMQIISYPQGEDIIVIEHQFPDQIVSSEEAIIFNERPQTTSFASDLEEIDALQRKFNRDLGLSDDATAISAYNPVLARWKFEKLKTKEEKEQFLSYELHQMETGVRERCHAAQSVTKYLIDEKKQVRHELFADEPISVVLERGVAYRSAEYAKDPSIPNESEREKKELIGWKKIESRLTDPETPLGTKVVLLSPPSTVDGTIYTKQFVDIFELSEEEDSKKRFFKATRYEVDLSYKGYREKALLLDPSYFDEKEGAVDGWMLSHPIFIDPASDNRSASELFDDIFSPGENTMTEEDFQKVYTLCLPLIHYYLEVLSRADFESREFAIAFNAVLNKVDESKKSVSWHKENAKMFGPGMYKEVTVFSGNIADEARRLGMRVVQQEMVGCGKSGGYSIGGDSSAGAEGGYFDNSVARFGLISSDKYGSLQFICHHCNGVNTRAPNILEENCKVCFLSVRC